MGSFVEVKGVNKSFVSQSGDKKQLFVLDNLTFSLDQGEVASLIGPTGCGKTTLIRILAGIEDRDSGSILVDGAELEGPSSERAVVFQTFNLFPWMTVSANIGFGLLDLSEEERTRRVEKYVKLVGLAGFESYHPHQLSGGMQQRVGVARALAVEPKVLLIDEPLANVDAQTAEQLLDQFLRIFRETNKTVIYVTHNMDEAVYISDKIIVLSGRPATVKEIYPDDLPQPRWEKDIRAMPEFGVLRSKVRNALGFAK